MLFIRNKIIKLNSVPFLSISLMNLWSQTEPAVFFNLSFFQFDKWTDSQRRRILTGLLERCSLSQQKFCCRKLQEKIPAEALDFTTKLPRVLSLYIFSFLDPRSLCRCAQVKRQRIRIHVL